MKQRSTTPVSDSSFAAKAALVACAVLMTISMPLQFGKIANANYDAQIQAAKQKAKQNEGQAEHLSKMADSYQAELKQLEAHARTIQDQINKSQERHDKLKSDIEANEKKIAANTVALEDTIVEIHVDSDISPLEMVASSNSIGDIVDKQTQQATIQNKLNDTIDQIEKLQAKLKSQQEEVKVVLDDQKSQRKQLAAKEAEKQKLIRDTRGKEDVYRDRARANNKRVEELRAQQAEANRQAAAAAMAAANNNGAGNWQGSVPPGVAGGGGYPWVQGPLDYGVDPWGLYYRECVSYTAWKVASTGRFVPHFAGQGNANQWPSTVARHGIQSGSTPKAGSVAMMPIGYYGHTMYVESVNGDGTITVSDYNLAWDGNYRKYNRSAGGLTYIYF